MSGAPGGLRILAVSNLWQGANDYAFVRAFRRMGHSVRVVSEKEFSPTWKSRPMRLIRRALQGRIAAEFNAALLREAQAMRPDLLFVFKGALVTGKSLRALKAMGIVTIQFYPDVSFHTHRGDLLAALPEYDWVFTTKSFGLTDMKAQLGVTRASLLPHGFDPETHFPVSASAADRRAYACDASFIGNVSGKKLEILRHLQDKAGPGLDLRIWGPQGWVGRMECYQGHEVTGLEYAKAIGLSKINIALLSERRKGASSGDQVTARTFEIPGAGGFMLHECTEEAESFFDDGRECVFFDGPDDLAVKIAHYLAHDEERRAIAEAGRARCLSGGYSTEDRARVVIAQYHRLREAPDRQAAKAPEGGAACLPHPRPCG